MPAITKPSNHFNATLYTGDGTSNRTITGTGFQPDWLWLKMRNDVDDNILVDSVRGGSKRIKSNTTDAESDISYPTLASDGFVVSSGAYNNSAKTFVAWQWKAGGTAVTNTTGTISAQVSANPTAGFSIVSYTGNGTSGTIGHGLGVAPQMIIVKRRSAVQDWIVAHIGIGGTGGMGNNFMYLNLTDASSAYAGCFNNTLPTTSVFSVGSDTSTNASGSTYVAYCYAPVAGYSAFGSYTGNGSADGPFIYTGFKPRFILTKSSSLAGGNWLIQDTARGTYNAVGNSGSPNSPLVANSSGTEINWNGTFSMDILSNGFKMRTTAASLNQSAETYVYAAFAENPFKYANAR